MDNKKIILGCGFIIIICVLICCMASIFMFFFFDATIFDKEEIENSITNYLEDECEVSRDDLSFENTENITSKIVDLIGDSDVYEVNYSYNGEDRTIEMQAAYDDNLEVILQVLEDSSEYCQNF